MNTLFKIYKKKIGVKSDNFIRFFEKIYFTDFFKCKSPNIFNAFLRNRKRWLEMGGEVIIAWRFVLCILDSNRKLYLGFPSNKIEVSDSTFLFIDVIT